LIVTPSPEFLNRMKPSSMFRAEVLISGERTGIRRVRELVQAPEVPAGKTARKREAPHFTVRFL
jgi:hypothetical protein